jgi:hypothetical protein
MSKRNPYARALRIHAQRVIPDKRDKSLRQIWNEEVERGVTDEEREFVERLS